MNGYLMHKDNIVSRIEDDIVLDDNLMLPLQLHKGASVEGWLTDRAIDSHRTNSRLLKKVIRITDSSDISTVLKAHAATVTDNYWIKLDNEKVSYKDILFNDDSLSDVALYGDFNSVAKAEDYNSNNSKSPELTNTGSFEKCWKLHNNGWVMYKRGNELELFSEIFIYKLGKHFGFNMASYEKYKDCVITENFTKNKLYDFEPANAIVGSEENYNYNYNKLSEFGKQIADDYVKIIFMDTLCYNMDRHTKNYGVLRDASNGTVISLAPNFDNNIALVARGYTSTDISKNDFLMNLWCDFIKETKYSFELPELNRDSLVRIADSINCDVDKSYVVDFVMNRYDYLVQFQKQLCINSERTSVKEKLENISKATNVKNGKDISVQKKTGLIQQ